MEGWLTLTASKTRNREQGVVMTQYLWCSKIKKEKNDTVLFTPNKYDSENKRSVDTILECHIKSISDCEENKILSFVGRKKSVIQAKGNFDKDFT